MRKKEREREKGERETLERKKKRARGREGGEGDDVIIIIGRRCGLLLLTSLKCLVSSVGLLLRFSFC
jgi:hypothetical protein